MRSISLRFIRAGLFALLGLAALGDSASGGVTITRTNYHGWPDCYALANGQAQIIVVPAIGRIMQFGFVGEEGVFWENRSLDGRVTDGQLMTWAAKEWVNFGGDKTWPAPESDWSGFTARKGWRPPPAFDGLPSEAEVRGSSVTLTSLIDPFYGISVRREIRLHSNKPEMTITTTYDRIRGEPLVVSIWVITQLKEPEGVFARVEPKGFFESGFTPISRGTIPSLKIENGLLSLTRDPTAPHKIGLDADSMLWVGSKHMLRVDSPRVRKAEYPDNGSSTEIYTSADPLPYIELETLGPLKKLKEGDKVTRKNTYTLFRRTRPTAEAEARAVLR